MFNRACAGGRQNGVVWRFVLLNFLWQRRIVFLHPPYSPDLAPSDFHLHATLKNAIRGNRFGNNDDVLKK